jgi:hypothetical protein
MNGVAVVLALTESRQCADTDIRAKATPESTRVAHASA